MFSLGTEKDSKRASSQVWPSRGLALPPTVSDFAGVGGAAVPWDDELEERDSRGAASLTLPENINLWRSQMKRAASSR